MEDYIFKITLRSLRGQWAKKCVGYYVGHISCGQCGYADDIQMLSPSFTGLQKLVHVSEGMGREYDVSFNAKETVWLCFGNQMPYKQLRHIAVISSKILWDTSAKHLGTYFLARVITMTS